MKTASTAKVRRRALRRQSTDAELRLWYHLRNRHFQKAKFHRQHSLGPFIVDFCSLELHLVIELDGSQHAEAIVYDELRTRHLRELGFRVVRFWNSDVFEQFDAVLEAIRLEVEAPGETPGGASIP